MIDRRRILGAIAALACAPTPIAASPPVRDPANLDEVRPRVIPKLQVELRKDGFRWGAPIFLRIFKKSSELELWVKKDHRFALFKTYEICSFSGGLGPKRREGDRQSPEGFYFVSPAQMNPKSRYHLSFNLGYPNPYEQAYGRTGGNLMVHGDCTSIGCYAMTDEGIEEIYLMAEAAFTGGQSFFAVHAFPFRMTEKNLERYEHTAWSTFWQNLREGNDMFEATGRPPTVSTDGRRYVFWDRAMTVSETFSVNLPRP